MSNKSLTVEGPASSSSSSSTPSTTRFLSPNTIPSLSVSPSPDHSSSSDPTASAGIRSPRSRPRLSFDESSLLRQQEAKQKKGKTVVDVNIFQASENQVSGGIYPESTPITTLIPLNCDNKKMASTTTIGTDTTDPDSNKKTGSSGSGGVRTISGGLKTEMPTSILRRASTPGEYSNSVFKERPSIYSNNSHPSLQEDECSEIVRLDNASDPNDGRSFASTDGKLKPYDDENGTPKLRRVARLFQVLSTPVTVRSFYDGNFHNENSVNLALHCCF